jgi:anti-sigma factor RsiW
MCDSKDLLVGYLYGEVDAAGRRTFETHLATCAECRDEVAGLRTTRTALAQWTPPEPDFAFTIVRRPAAPERVRFQVSPAWGLAAAALLVLALGTAIANVEVRYGSDGVVVRTGWNRAAPEPPPSTETRPTQAEWKAQVDALNRRLRDLESSSARPEPAAVAGQPSADTEILRQVHDLLGASEARQQRSLARVVRDLNTQRQVDLAGISRSMSRLQNASDAEVKQYRDSLLRLGRVAYQQNASQR